MLKGVFMEILRDSNEDEIILTFLQGEINSDRFSDDLNKALIKLNLTKDIILNPNLSDINENYFRKQVLGEFRGYGKGDKLFENFPEITEYKFAVFNNFDLDRIFYINYSYWNELSKYTSLSKVAADSIQEGIEPYGVSNKPFWNGVEVYKSGKIFKPIILLTSDYQEFIILEGHSRVTIYALVGDLFKQAECYILKCGKEELKKWNGEE